MLNIRSAEARKREKRRRTKDLNIGIAGSISTSLISFAKQRKRKYVTVNTTAVFFRIFLAADHVFFKFAILRSFSQT
jgi:hypothetical protein